MFIQLIASKNTFRNFSANSSTTSFTATSKRDIMHSAKLKTMCSAQGFYSSKGLFYKFFIISMRLKAHCRTEMMGLIGAGNNPMVGMTVAVAVAIEEASK